MFRRLGVFAGGFTLELAQARRARRRASTSGWCWTSWAQLIDKSLVIAEGEDEPRYRLLEPTRAFALEQLAAAGESEAVLRRHAEAVCDAMAMSTTVHVDRALRPRRVRLLAETRQPAGGRRTGR